MFVLMTGACRTNSMIVFWVLLKMFLTRKVISFSVLGDATIPESVFSTVFRRSVVFEVMSTLLSLQQGTMLLVISLVWLQNHYTV